MVGYLVKKICSTSLIETLERSISIKGSIKGSHNVA